MAEAPVTDAKVDRDEAKIAHPFMEVSRKILLAAVGAASLTQEALEDFVGKLVERGEIAEKDGRVLLKEIAEKQRKTIRSTEEKAYQHIYEALKKLNVPTKRDIDELNQKVVELTQKIDALKKS